MKTRQLKDRVEAYEDVITGACTCGKRHYAITGSSASSRTDRVRYTDDEGKYTAWNVFRCNDCKKVISDTFTIF